MNGDPRKEQRNTGIGSDVFSFSAAEIGEEDEALLIEGFEKNHPLPGPTVFIHCGQRHCVGLNHFQFLGLRKPGLELINGIGGQILSMKARSCVFLP